MSAPDATWRVYLREWLTVYTPDGQEAWDHFIARYQGRVRDEDVRVTGEGAVGQVQVLQMKLWNLKGEFKAESDAWSLSGELLDLDGGSRPHVVQRGSSVEQAMLDYGKKMLKA